MQTYLSLLHDLLTHGRERTDRTGTGTLGLFGAQLRFDLKQGFPLLTTKRIFWRGVVAELLWMLSGDTNAKTLQAQGVHIWDDWATAEQCALFGRAAGDLGPVYGKQFRRIVHSEWIQPMLFDAVDPPEDTPFSKEIVVDWNRRATSLLGREVDSGCGRFTIIQELPPTNPSERTRFKIKFHLTGSEQVIGYTQAETGKVSDPWAKTVFGVGRYGAYDEADPCCAMLLNVWREMLRRCYSTECASFPSYGGAGVHVAPEWFTFANFQRDAKKLPNWFLKLDHPLDYSIDKDIQRASNRYSLLTCSWATHEEQSLNTSTGRPFEATDPAGKVVFFRSFGEAKRDHGLNQSAVHRCLNGKLHTHHGWSSFAYLENPGRVLRTIVVDQLKKLLSELKHDPMSRRHVISLWNPTEINAVTLPPCHGVAIQFYVQDGFLSCHMYQRSGDAMLGIPFNIASYALLTHLVAHVTGLQVGSFVHTFGDVHLYKNHVAQAREQLTRTPRPLPQLRIARATPDLFSIVPEDLVLEGYDPYPAIKAEVAV